ncbi:hypothetical protein E2C01_043051 [Portunus trituberculatus]|uniref:Uncharacterized protein n=1 Tax=Portunus trituberculatus TaxID=210409 RepID=A0A5B7FW90_PORTR|nr:hypothetical protein [Portunus trituberculatus]
MVGDGAKSLLTPGVGLKLDPLNSGSSGDGPVYTGGETPVATGRCLKFDQVNVNSVDWAAEG